MPPVTTGGRFRVVPLLRVGDGPLTPVPRGQGVPRRTCGPLVPEGAVTSTVGGGPGPGVDLVVGGEGPPKDPPSPSAPSGVPTGPGILEYFTTCLTPTITCKTLPTFRRCTLSRTSFLIGRRHSGVQ